MKYLETNLLCKNKRENISLAWMKVKIYIDSVYNNEMRATISEILEANYYLLVL